jgi:hydrogenase expression/formation protein HypE
MKPATILSAHGGGGRLMHRLLEEAVLPALRNPALDARHDGAVVDAGRLAFSTDAYVVKPLFFPGGDIGSLAVHGTVNDLAMCGARPRWMAASLILEEGFPVADLRRIAESMGAAARACGVEVVTGDTKVVERGRGDGVYVAAAGVGLLDRPREIRPSSVRPGDAILLSGDLGRHGIAILAARETLRFESPIRSDSAPLDEPVLSLLEAGIEVHCLRDLTRGGLAAALNEIASGCGRPFAIDEAAIPVDAPVRAACEMLGLDPLQVACEGRFVAFVPEVHVEGALEAMRRHEVAAASRRIGRVGDGGDARVVMKTSLGTSRIVDMPSGEQLPRIC